MLTPGQGSSDGARGGILQNFNLQNVNAKLAIDTQLHFSASETKVIDP